MNKKIVTIIIVIAIVALGAFVVSRVNNSPGLGRTAVTYTDTKTGISFNIPVGWRVKNAEDNSTTHYVSIESPDFETYQSGEIMFQIVKGGEINFSVRDPYDTKTLADLIKFNELGNDGPPWGNLKRQEVAGRPAIVYSFRTDKENGYKFELIENDKVISLQVLAADVDSEQVFNQAVNTFKRATR